MRQEVDSCYREYLLRHLRACLRPACSCGLLQGPHTRNLKSKEPLAMADRKGELRVQVISAQGLRDTAVFGIQDPYVQVVFQAKLS